MIEAFLLFGGFVVVGYILGLVTARYFYARVHKLLGDLDQKYNRLVTIISEWQKKI